MFSVYYCIWRKLYVIALVCSLFKKKKILFILKSREIRRDFPCSHLVLWLKVCWYVVCCLFHITAVTEEAPVPPPRTTRGNPHLNTSQVPFGLHFTFPLIPGSDQSSTPVPLLHTQTRCEVLICLAVISERSTCVCLFVIWPWTVCSLFWSFAACPDLDCVYWTVIVCFLPWSLAWCSTLSLPCLYCSALPVSDPVLPDYSQ